MNCVKTLRSLRADYGLVPKANPEIFVKSSQGESSEALSEFKILIQTLANGSKLTIGGNSLSFPDGCGIAIVNENCDVGIQLKGIIEPEKEILKLEKEIEKLNKSLEKLMADMEKPSYAKRPQNVKDKDAEKLKNGKVEVGKMEEAINKFRNMKL